MSRKILTLLLATALGLGATLGASGLLLRHGGGGVVWLLGFGGKTEARDASLACVFAGEVRDREYRNERIARTWWWSCDRW